MTDQSLVLLDIMQNDFEKALIPNPDTEVARNMAVNAAELMRRRLVEVVDMPPLRQEALAAYRGLLPEVETLIGPLSPTPWRPH